MKRQFFLNLIIVMNLIFPPSYGSEGAAIVRTEKSTSESTEYKTARDEATKKEELKKSEEAMQERREQIERDLKTKASVQVTIDDPNAPVAAKDAAQRTLATVDARIAENSSQLQELMQQIDNLSATPAIIDQMQRYEKTLQEAIETAQNPITIIQQEFNRIARGSASALMSEVTYDSYNNQRRTLKALMTALDTFSSKFAESSRTSLLSRMNDRITEIDLFIQQQPLVGNKLDANLKLSSKIPSDQARDLKIQLSTMDRLSEGDKISILREISQIIKHYQLNDVLPMLDKKVDALNLNKTPLAKKLNLALETPEKQQKILEDYTFDLLTTKNKILTPEETKEILDTARSYGLEQNYADFTSMLQERLTLEATEAAQKTPEIAEDVSNAVQAIAQAPDIAIEKTVEVVSPLLAATSDAFNAGLENINKELLDATIKVSEISQKVGEAMVGKAANIETVNKLGQITRDLANKVQIAGIEHGGTLGVVRSISPDAGAKFDKALENVGKVEGIASGPVGKMVNWASEKIAPLLKGTGRKLISFGDATFEIADDLRQAQQLDRDIKIKNEILKTNDPEARLALMEKAELAVEDQRSLFIRSKQGYFDKFTSLAKQYMTDMGSWIKGIAKEKVEPDLVQAQKNVADTQELYIRHLLDITGKTKEVGWSVRDINNIADPQAKKAKIAQLMEEALSKFNNLDQAPTKEREALLKQQQKLTDLNNTLRKFVNELALNLEAYSGSLAVAYQNIDFTINAWDALIVDENSSVIDTINGIFDFRQQKMAYLEALKENINSLRDETSRGIQDPTITTLNNELTDKTIELINGSMIDLALENYQFVKAIKNNIETGRRTLELEIANKQLQSNQPSAAAGSGGLGSL